jgi:hypothetical protein
VTNDIVSTAPEEKIDPVKKPGKDLPKSETKHVETDAVVVTTKAPSNTQANNTTVIPETKNTVAQTKPQVVANNNTQKPSFTKQPDPVKPNTEPGKQDIATVASVKSNTTPAPVTEKKEIKAKEVAIPVKPDVVKADITQKAAVVEGRKSEFAQEVIFKSDSLVISLYDNGVIDGDTVSVFMNGVVILAKQGLKASAIKKTIYLTPGKDDEFTLVLFADNLGLYPPNTGLLVVRDGNDVYNLRFSADFQKNAGVVFRRKQ